MPTPELEKENTAQLSLFDGVPEDVEGFVKFVVHGDGYSAMQGVVGDFVSSPEKNKKGGGLGRGFR